MTNDDLRIITCLHSDYDIDVATLRPLDLGADMNARLYHAKAQNNTSYFVKLKHGHQHDISLDIVELLHDAGMQQIIAPIKTTQGKSSKIIEDATVIVYPFIEGQNGFSRQLTDKQWVTLGKALSQVHNLNIPFSIQNRIRQETYTPKWREAVRSLITRIETMPKDGDDIAIKLMISMQENTNIIHQLVNQAELLGDKIKRQSHPFVLCHSDIHGGNVLISDNDTLYIVDWDEPIMAPKERDLMFIGGGVANVWNKPHEEALFYQGYGKTEVNKTILSYYRHERIVEDIAEYGQALLLTTEGENRATMLRHFTDMFAPNGVVDIALRTNTEH
jgi:spectinomycin phosphotransferase